MEPSFPIKSRDMEVKFESRKDVEFLLLDHLADADLLSVADAEGRAFYIEVFVAFARCPDEDTYDL